MKINHEKISHPRLLTVILMLLGALLLSGCGSSSGGSDGGNNEPTIQTFNLYDPDYYTPGYQKGASALEGEARLNGAAPGTGTELTGTYLIETGVEEDFEGQPAIPVVTSQELNTASDSMTTYYTTDADPQPIKIVRESDGFTWTATTISLLPAVGEIGDSGTLTSYTGEGGSEDERTLTETWELKDPASGLADQADLVITSVVKDSAGETLYTEVLTLTIDETGDYQSIQIITTYPDPGPTLTLSGDFD